MKPLRPNACVVLTDKARHKVLVFRRVNEDWRENPWQFPQGGLKKGESPLQGMLRELEEEIGTADAEVLDAAPQPIRYEYPPDVVESLVQQHSKMARYRGQEQHWFLARLRQGTRGIHFNHWPPEFNAFRWVTPARAVELVVPFKKRAYREGLSALGLLARQPVARKK